MRQWRKEEGPGDTEDREGWVAVGGTVYAGGDYDGTVGMIFAGGFSPFVTRQTIKYSPRDAVLPAAIATMRPSTSFVRAGYRRIHCPPCYSEADYNNVRHIDAHITNGQKAEYKQQTAPLTQATAPGVNARTIS